MVSARGGCINALGYVMHEPEASTLQNRDWNGWAVVCAAASSETSHVLVTTPLPAMPVDDFAYWMGKLSQTTKNPPKSLYGLVCCFKQLEANGVFMMSTNTADC